MDWNYIAGFFDGEGTFSMKNSCIRIAISQTNKEVLDEIKRFTSLGNVCIVSKRKPHWKDCWMYYITNQKDVFIFLDRIKEKVIVKKNIIKENLPLIKYKILKTRLRKKNFKKKINKITTLRKLGFSYREIQKKSGVDWSYARKLILKNM